MPTLLVSQFSLLYTGGSYNPGIFGLGKSSKLKPVNTTKFQNPEYVTFSQLVAWIILWMYATFVVFYRLFVPWPKPGCSINDGDMGKSVQRTRTNWRKYDNLQFITRPPLHRHLLNIHRGNFYNIVEQSHYKYVLQYNDLSLFVQCL